MLREIVFKLVNTYVFTFVPGKLEAISSDFISKSCTDCIVDEGGKCCTLLAIKTSQAFTAEGDPASPPM